MNPLAYEEMNEIELNHWWFVGRRRILKEIILSTGLKEELSILEIGCGTGGNLSMLSSLGKLTAVEMDLKASEVAKRKNIHKTNDIKVLVGSLPNNMPTIENKFDLICMFDVLEHIQEDKEALIKIKSYLKESGRLIITVPAYQWLYGHHDEYLHHKRRYSKKELIKAAIHSGYKINRITYFNTILFPIALVVRVYEKIKGKNFEKGSINKQGKWSNEILRYLFEIEKIILKRANFHYGLSMLCILSI